MNAEVKWDLSLLASKFAMNFVASNNKEYSKSRFIQEIKSKHGVRNFIRVWYWSRVYKEFVDYYNAHLIDLMGERLYEVKEQTAR